MDADERRRALDLAARDARYFAERVASAVPQPEPADTVVVVFGSSVTILRDDGRRWTFRIVGEDEADPRAGSIAYASCQLAIGSLESGSVRPWRWMATKSRLSPSNRSRLPPRRRKLVGRGVLARGAGRRALREAGRNGLKASIGRGSLDARLRDRAGLAID